MAFIEIRFPVALSFGSSGGPERRTDVISLVNGVEHRSTAWAHGRRRYDAGLGLRTLDDIHAVLSLFEICNGRLHGFRWRDWADHKSCGPSGTPEPGDCALGVGDGETRAFQLVKIYHAGGAIYRRPVVKPSENSVVIGLDGQAVDQAAFSVDHATGIVTLATPPAAGVAITAGFEFDVPVRFDTDRIEVNLASFEAGAIPSIPIVEIKV